MREELAKYFTDERCLDYIMEHLDMDFSNDYEKIRNVFYALPNDEFIEEYEAYVESITDGDMLKFVYENLYKID